MSGELRSGVAGHPRQSDFVTVGHAYGPLEWTLTVSMLRATGITVWACDQSVASVAWDKMIAWGGVSLRVPSSQARDAEEVLSEFAPVRKRRRVERLLLAAIIFLLFNVPPPPSGFFPVRAAITGRGEV